MDPTIPASWHSDPEDPTMLRWWDGAQWTNHRCPVPVAPQPGQQAQGPGAAPFVYPGTPGNAPNGYYGQPAMSSGYLPPASQGMQTYGPQSNPTNQRPMSQRPVSQKRA